MERLTQTASRLVVFAYGLDGKSYDKYEFFGDTAQFADVCNTIDFLRGSTNLQPVESKKAATR